MVVDEVLTWWGQQLLSLSRRQTRAEQRDTVIATQHGGTLDVAVRRRGRLGTLGRFPLTDTGTEALVVALGPQRPPLELRLSQGLMLEQTVSLPLAAERDPESVLRYEMDRLTPFTADALYWTWAIERRDLARVQLQVRVTLALRAQVDPTLAVLTRAGLQVRTLSGDDGRIIPLDATRAGRWQRYGVAAMAALCAALTVAIVAVPFILQTLTAQRIERQIAELRPAVTRAEALRRSLGQAAAGIDVLAAQRARVGDPLATLAVLTDILPDDTTLSDLTMRQRIITLVGQSAGAARLIPVLAADPALRDPAFTAPVTRNDTQRTDMFSIRVEAVAP